MRTQAGRPAATVSITAADDLLRSAREEAGHGSMHRAWQHCLSAARLGRELGEATILARAAITITDPGVQPGVHIASRQALCLEAMALLGDDDPELKEMVESQLTALTDAWSTDLRRPGQRVEHAEAQRRSLALHGEHARARGPAGVGDRLAIAGQLVDLGLTSGQDDILARGWLWRLDALRQLDLRPEWNATLIDLAEVVGRLDSPSWRWRLAAVRASFALQEDRLEDVPALLTEAREHAAVAEVDDGAYIDLVLRSSLADRTGEGLETMEVEVRHALAEMPFLAQGWRGHLLARLDRTAEAAAVWRSLAPHVQLLPPTATEWLVVQAGYAELAVLADDRTSAAHLRLALEPFGSHHVAAIAMTSYLGPVALVLGRLSAFLDDDISAELWFREAEGRAEAVVAPWYATQAREELARLGCTLGPLSPREGQIARLVAQGLTNREVAARLVLSERTVEQHVRSILHKLGLHNRTAIVAWLASRSAG